MILMVMVCSYTIMMTCYRSALFDIFMEIYFLLNDKKIGSNKLTTDVPRQKKLTVDVLTVVRIVVYDLCETPSFVLTIIFFIKIQVGLEISSVNTI